jgi:hypothetical protein
VQAANCTETNLYLTIFQTYIFNMMHFEAPTLTHHGRDLEFGHDLVLLLLSGVVGPVHLDDVMGVDFGVNLGGGQLLMSQKGLNVLDSGAIPEHVCGRGFSQAMATGLGSNSRGFSSLCRHFRRKNEKVSNENEKVSVPFRLFDFSTFNEKVSVPFRPFSLYRPWRTCAPQ